MDHNPRSDLRSLIQSGLSKSLMSLVIKVATAGLTYGMFVILSRTMGIEQYGYFAFGLSLATILAIGANFGQQTAILRYWPEEMVAGPRRQGAGGAAVRRGADDHCGPRGVGRADRRRRRGRRHRADPGAASLRRGGADPAAGAGRILELGAPRAGFGVDGADAARHRLAAGAAARSRSRSTMRGCRSTAGRRCC